MRSIKELVKEDLCPDVDGFYYYLPKNNGGSLSAHVLREIANILDEMNEPWEKQITQFFEENPSQTSEDMSFGHKMSDNKLFEPIDVFAIDEVLVFGDFVDEG